MKWSVIAVTYTLKMCWWFFKGDSISLNHCSNNTQGDDDIDCCGDYIETDCVSAASILSVLSARGMHTHETVNARDVFSDMNGGIDAEVAANHLPLPDGIVPNLHYPWITTSVLNNPCYILQKNCSRRSQCTWLWSSPNTIQASQQMPDAQGECLISVAQLNYPILRALLLDL